MKHRSSLIFVLALTLLALNPAILSAAESALPGEGTSPSPTRPGLTLEQPTKLLVSTSCLVCPSNCEPCNDDRDCPGHYCVSVTTTDCPIESPVLECECPVGASCFAPTSNDLSAAEEGSS